MVHGSRARVLGEVDLVSTADLRRLADVPGPCVSVYLPSTHFGPGTRSGPSRLHHLVTEALSRLVDAGTAKVEAEELLGSLRRLEDDDVFWQHQAEGLALFTAPGFLLSFRLARHVEERVHVGDGFRLLPLVAQLGGDTTFYVLALTQNSVRVLQASETTVGELEVRGLPESMASTLPEAEPDRVRGAHSIGALGTITHGQGTEADYDKRALERYFRAVDDVLVAQLRPVRPLVLACVGHYLPVYRAVSRYRAVWPQAVEGSPQRSSAQELHDKAWRLVGPHFHEAADEQLARYRESAGTGLTAVGAADVLAAARQGRVQTLLLDVATAADTDVDLIDRAVVETLWRSGHVVPVGPDAELGTPEAAVLRY